MKKLAAPVLLLIIACGKRGDPHPPVPIIPKATSDLVVAQRGPKLILSWSYPSLTTAGQKLTGIRRVVLYRYIEELPATQPPRDPKTLLPGDIDPTLPVAVALFAKIPPPGPMQFAKLRQKIDSIEGANLAGATVGARLSYEDSPPLHTTDGRPVRIDYAVVTEGATAKSATSNLASIVPIDAPLPPAPMGAEAKPEGVVLSWTAPEKSITGAEKPHVIGYNIYRFAGGEDVDELSTPLNGAPVSKTTYTDVPAYGTYSYRVTAVSAVGPPRIESDPSSAVIATFKDLLPPPTPSGLTALVETNAVRLVWDAVEAPDLAGYNVYRTEGIGEEHVIAARIPFTQQPIKETNFRDTIPKPGIYFFYEVTAIDKNGNESPPAKTDWVLVPRVP